jgi:large subunit ribosomal protein L24
MSMQKLKVGDTVQVMAGAERTQKLNRGKILSIDGEARRLKVEGLRLVKRHIKKGRDRANPEGGIIETAGTIAMASVSLVCPKCDKPTRVGIKVTDAKENTKKRFCKKCEAVID